MRTSPGRLPTSATLVLTISLAAFLPARPSLAAFTSSVTATGYTSSDNAVNQNPLDLLFTTDPVTGVKSVTGNGFSRRTSEAIPIVSYAGVDGAASVGPGVLKASVHGLALIGPAGPNIPTTTHGTPRAAANFGATFRDDVVLGGNLPVGTPVTYRATVRFNVLTNRPGHVGPQFSGYDTGSLFFTYFVGFNVGAEYFFPNGLFTSVPEFGFELPVEVTGLVGDVLPVGASLGASADDRAGYYDNGASSYGGLTETIIDASHTAQIFLDPITPGLTFVSATGHDYSFVPVPEPAATAALLLFATPVLARRRRRRTALRE
jgi:hypothetical protein